MLKTVVLAAIPRAIEIQTTAVKPGALRTARSANTTSCISLNKAHGSPKFHGRQSGADPLPRLPGVLRRAHMVAIRRPHAQEMEFTSAGASRHASRGTGLSLHSRRVDGAFDASAAYPRHSRFVYTPG